MEHIAELYADSDEENVRVDDPNTNNLTTNNDHNANDNTTITNNKEKAMELPINLVPEVDILALQKQQYHNPTEKQILHNPTVDYLYAPIQGPLREGETPETAFQAPTTTLTGYVEFHHMDTFTFDEQYHTFQNYGYAIDPSKGINNQNSYIGDEESIKSNTKITIYNSSNVMDKNKKKNHKKRVKSSDPSNIEGYLGPWAPPIKSSEEEAKLIEDLKKRKEQWELEHPNHDNNGNNKKKRKLNKNIIDNNSDNDNDDEDLMNANNDTNNPDYDEKNKERIAEKRRKQHEEQKLIEKTEFHGTNFHDYQGRTYMYCPPEQYTKDFLDRKNFIPKQCIHTWNGHKKGVNSIQFFPRKGHLLLSCSNDFTVKIWDVHNDRKCLRTYIGHTAGVRNICFNRDGTKFLTTSFDKWIKLFDTEYGKVIWRGTSGKVPFDAKLYPENENEFICGQKNKLAVQWDMRSNRIVQKYDEHLSSVNTITFIDQNRRFITTSDDKKIFIWDYGVPVVIKHIAEPNLHSVPFVVVHPNTKWFLGQSMDNQIVVYATGNRFRQNIKKHFKGHLSAGFACQVDVSPDGRFVMSGDAQGRLFFWDWKSSKQFGQLKCHQQVTIGCVWHPIEKSKIATCSWDGTIKYWD